MKSEDIKKIFLDFFRSKGHKKYNSIPLALKDDPSLMFVNAGMNQFKDIFLGSKKIEDKKAVNCQPCLRVSGKHNDLEEVGFDLYHHTMFEMLGNWSFNDYSKKEAIEFAWELLINVFKIDKNRLYVTVFNGNKNDGVDKDHESFLIWKSLIPEERIIFCSKKDNFWEMSNIGPCGPCTEIHIDLRDEHEIKKQKAVKLINKDHPLVIELWNIVFVEYTRNKDLLLNNLDKKFVDTGMGFERLCMVLQNKKSTYDIDIFQILINSICKKSSVQYGLDEKKDIAIRIIADHLRAVCFSIADGQIPDNTGAGYVIRRILRRAIRYAFSYLKMENPFIFSVVKDLVKAMPSYNQIKKNQNFIEDIIKNEEKLFLITLNKGLNLIDSLVSYAKSKEISGESIFELYDTYGFPVDLTEIILKEKGLSFNKDQFEKCLILQKERSKSNQKNIMSEWVVILEDDVQEFIGYNKLSCTASLVKYREVKCNNEKYYHLVFNYTPFYAESGGQSGDTGYIEISDKKIFIIDTLSDVGLTVHVTKELPDNLKVECKLFVDQEKRFFSSVNHSATHLLHFALKNILGDHIEQRGSYVGPDYLRFDFSHFEKVNSNKLIEIELFVNNFIIKNILLEHEIIPFNDAKSKGAVALFGEKYGDLVRVIKFGESIELCGGTHVNSTGEIGLFKIINESSSSSGVRRIEALTSLCALKYLQNLELDVSRIRDLVKNKDLVQGVENLIEEKKFLQDQIDFYKQKEINNYHETFLLKLKKLKNYNLVFETTSLPPDLLKSLCLSLFKKNKNIVVFLTSVFDDKIYFTIGVSKDLCLGNKIDLKNNIQKLSRSINAKGGGSQDFYFYTGNNIKNKQKLIEIASEIFI